MSNKEDKMKKLANKVIRRLRIKPRFVKYLVFANSLTNSFCDFPINIPYSIEQLPANIESICASLSHIPREHKPDLDLRIERGQRCYVAKSDGQVIWVGWVAFGYFYAHILDREYELASDEVYGYGAYTVPQFRGRGVHPAASQKLGCVLAKQGFKRMLLFIDPKNLPAMRLPKKLGYEPMGCTGFIEMFGLRWYFHRDKGSLRALKKHYYWRKV